MRVTTPEDDAAAYAYLRARQPRGLIIFHAQGELLYHHAMANGLPRDGVPTVAVKGYASHRALRRMWAACRRAHKPRRSPRSTQLTRHRAALVCIREHRIQRRRAGRVTIPVWPPGAGKRRRKFDRQWAKWEAEMAPINAACELPTIAEQIEALRKIGTPRAVRQIEWLQLWEDGDKAIPPIIIREESGAPVEVKAERVP